MAIIYSYPNLPLSKLTSDDLLVITDIDSTNNNPTKSVTLADLATYVTNTGTGTGTTNKIVKWADGPNGQLGDSIMTESTGLIDLVGQFLSTSSPTVTQAAPVSGIKSVLAATASAPHIALYGDSKHTGATQANSNYGVYAKGEFEGTGGFTSFIIGGNLEARYDGSGSNGVNASMYGAYNLARATSAANGTVSYMIGANTQAKLQSANVTATNLQGQHTTVELTNGTAGNLIVNLLDFDTTGGGTVTGDFSYLQIQNDTMPTVNGTARAINSQSVLPSLFQGQVEIPLVPTGNPSAASKQYVDQQIASIPAGLVFKGNWDANTNTPTLASGVGTVGNYYVVSVAGNTNLDGITDWQVGDWAVFVDESGADKWDKIDQTFVQGSGTTGQVTFWNGINSVTGDDKLYWDNANKNLGIGTTSPTAKLHIQSSNSAATANLVYLENIGSGGSEGVSIKFNPMFNAESMIASNREGAVANACNLTFHTYNNATNEAMRITSGGNVGIGTNSPASKLHVGPDALVSGYTPTTTTLAVSDVTNGAELILRGQSPRIWYDVTAGGMGELYLDGAQYNILSGDPTSAGSSRFYIKADGNVGIGTNAPNQKLEVAGRVRVTTDPTVEVYEASNKRGGIQWDITNDYTNIFAVGGDIRFDTGGERMRITETGLVGIGTATPSAKLHISGSDSTESAIRQSRVGTVIWDQAIDSNGRLQWGTRATEGGTRTLRFELDDTGDVAIFPRATAASSGSGILYFKNVDDTSTTINGASIRTVDSSSNPSGADMRIQIASDAGTLYDAVTLDANGFLGIGTTSPQVSLDVVGAAKFTGVSAYISTTGNITISSSSSSLNLESDANLLLGPSSVIQIDGDAGSSGQVLTSNGGTAMTWTTPSGGGGTDTVIVRSTFYHGSNVIGSRYTMPVVYYNDNTSNPGYDDIWVAPYNCTLKTVFLGNSQTTPTCNDVQLSYAINSNTFTNFGASTVTNPATFGMTAEVNPNLSISKGDRVAFGFTTIVSGTQTGRFYGASATFIIQP